MACTRRPSAAVRVRAHSSRSGDTHRSAITNAAPSMCPRHVNVEVAGSRLALGLVSVAVGVEDPLAVAASAGIVCHDLQIRLARRHADRAELHVAAFEDAPATAAAEGFHVAQGRARVANERLRLPLADETLEDRDGGGRQPRARPRAPHVRRAGGEERHTEQQRRGGTPYPVTPPRCRAARPRQAAHRATR